MTLVHRWLATAALAAGLGMGAMTPTPAQAQDRYAVERVVVDLADVIFRGGYPYYRYGNAYGYYGNHYSNRYSRTYSQRRVSCDRNGNCVTRYYDPRYDRRYNGYDNRYYDRYDDRYGYGRGERYWDGYRWRTR